jgi:hypothetical protein
MSLLKTVNLAVAFGLELCMLLAFGYWGVQTGGTSIVKILLGLGAPLLAMLLWGILMAPLSPRRLTGLRYWLLEGLLYGLVVISLLSLDQLLFAILFAIIAVLNAAFTIVWRQDANSDL